MKKFTVTASSPTLDRIEDANQNPKKVVIMGVVNSGRSTLVEAIASALGKKNVELPKGLYEVDGTVEDVITTTIGLATGEQDVKTLYKEWAEGPDVPTIDNSEEHEQMKMDLCEDNGYLADLDDHVKKVHSNLMNVVNNLTHRAEAHDSSKFSDVEFIPFESTFPKLRSTTYGTPEYKALLVELGPALEHHYMNNDHHPEYFENGINDMDIFQLTEMLCDWKAAVERHADGNVFKSLEHNKTRFNIDDQLYSIMCNTIKRWND